MRPEEDKSRSLCRPKSHRFKDFFFPPPMTYLPALSATLGWDGQLTAAKSHPPIRLPGHSCGSIQHIWHFIIELFHSFASMESHKNPLCHMVTVRVWQCGPWSKTLCCTVEAVAVLTGRFVLSSSGGTEAFDRPPTVGLVQSSSCSQLELLLFSCQLWLNVTSGVSCRGQNALIFPYNSNRTVIPFSCWTLTATSESERKKTRRLKGNERNEGGKSSALSAVSFRHAAEAFNRINVTNQLPRITIWHTSDILFYISVDLTSLLSERKKQAQSKTLDERSSEKQLVSGVSTEKLPWAYRPAVVYCFNHSHNMLWLHPAAKATVGTFKFEPGWKTKSPFLGITPVK